MTKLRTAEGEMYTIPNGQIMKTLNLSKDWARAVVDIPVPSTADLGWVNEVLQEVCDTAMDDHELSTLLLGEPKLRGVESIELGMVNLRWWPARFRANSSRPVAGCGCWSSPHSLEPALPRPRRTTRWCSRDDRTRAEEGPSPGRSNLAWFPFRWPGAHLDPGSGRRVLRDLVDLCDLPARTASAGTGARRRYRAAGLHPRPVLYLGAAHRRSAAYDDFRNTHDPHNDDADGHHNLLDQRQRIVDADDCVVPAVLRSVRELIGYDTVLDTEFDGQHGAVAAADPPHRHAVSLDIGKSDVLIGHEQQLDWRAVMITVDHVTKQYKTSARPALDNVTVKIDKGEFVFLIGPPARESRPSCGCCWPRRRRPPERSRCRSSTSTKLSGRHVPKLRQVIGCVFQDFRLLQQKTVFENVAFALEVIGKPSDTIKKVVPEVLEMVGLSGKANRLPAELSGGSSSGWRSPGRSSTGRWSYWPTSRRATSTRRPAATSWTCWTGSTAPAPR